MRMKRMKGWKPLPLSTLSLKEHDWEKSAGTRLKCHFDRPSAAREAEKSTRSDSIWGALTNRSALIPPFRGKKNAAYFGMTDPALFPAAWRVIAYPLKKGGDGRRPPSTPSETVDN
jgi:hypothetical protein